MRTGGLADRAALFELATLAAAEEVRRRSGGCPSSCSTCRSRHPPNGPSWRRWSRSRPRCWSPCPRETIARWPRSRSSARAAKSCRAAALEKQGARREDSTSRPHACPLGEAGGASALAHLREYLFAEAAPAGPAEPGEAVFFSAPGEGREAVEIARRITEEARDGTPFDRMAILLRAPVAYSSLFETALHRAGIPAFFARGARRPDPAGRALLLLLDCALEKLSARRFAEYLSLGQVPTPGAGGAPPTGRQVWVAADDEALVLGPDDVAPEDANRAGARAPTKSRMPILPVPAPPTRPRALSSRAACARPGNGSGSSSTRR